MSDSATDRCIGCGAAMTADEIEYLTNTCNTCESALHKKWQASENGEIMPDSATSPSLRELSDRAPHEEWTLVEMPNDAGSRSNAFTSFGIEADGKTLLDTLNATGIYLAQEPDGDGGYDVWDEQGKAVIEYVLRLVQDHRAGHLLDAPTVAEREARARAEGPGWQPIETAPKDGTKVLVGWAGAEPRACRWRQEAGRWIGGGLENRPTHWMPLPAPPALIPEACHEG